MKSRPENTENKKPDASTKVTDLEEFCKEAREDLRDLGGRRWHMKSN